MQGENVNLLFCIIYIEKRSRCFSSEEVDWFAMDLLACVWWYSIQSFKVSIFDIIVVQNHLPLVYFQFKGIIVIPSGHISHEMWIDLIVI